MTTFTDFVRLVGKPYMWVQRICGLNFLAKELHVRGCYNFYLFFMFHSILKRRISSGLKRAVSSDLLKCALCMDALHSNGLLFTFIAGSFAKVVS